jgi:hypothetical protein
VTIAVVFALLTAFACGFCADRAFVARRRTGRIAAASLPIVGGLLCGATSIAFLSLVLRM